jgi:hypothetical protein
MNVVKLSATRIGRPYPREIFLVLKADGGIISMKNTNDTFDNQTRDRPVCSAMSQSKAPPRATNLLVYITKKYLPQASFSRSAKVCRFSFLPSEFNACNKLPKTRVKKPEERTSLKLKPSAGHQHYPVPFTSHHHNHFPNKFNENISLLNFYVARTVCIFLHSIFLITNKMHLFKYNKRGQNTNFISGVNSYTFRHQGANIRSFFSNKCS